MASTEILSINSTASKMLAQSIQDAKQAQEKQTPATQVNNPEPAQNQHSSTVVKLSTEGQRLSRSDTTNSQSSSTPSSTPPAKKPAEPPGIQFIESERKGGRVSAYA